MTYQQFVGSYVCGFLLPEWQAKDAGVVGSTLLSRLPKHNNVKQLSADGVDSHKVNQAWFVCYHTDSLGHLRKTGGIELVPPSMDRSLAL